MRAADWKVQQGKATQAVSDAVRSFPVAGRRLRDELVRFVGTVGLVGLGFLGLFILHQATLWAAVRPAVAFERAKVVVYTAELVWDGTARVGNAGLQMVDAVIPLWNAGSHYVVEPAIYVLLDVMALIFTQEPYPPHQGVRRAVRRVHLLSRREHGLARVVRPLRVLRDAAARRRRVRLPVGQHRARHRDRAPSAGGDRRVAHTGHRREHGGAGAVGADVVDGDSGRERRRRGPLRGVHGAERGGGAALGHGLHHGQVPRLRAARDRALRDARDDHQLCGRSDRDPRPRNRAADAARHHRPAHVCDRPLLPERLGHAAAVRRGVRSNPARDPVQTRGTRPGRLPGRCVDEHCFETDSDAVADLIVFTSVPIVWQRFKAVLRPPSTATRASSTDSASCPTWTGSTRRPRPCPRPCAPSASCARRAACDSPDPSTRAHTRARAPGGDARLCTPPSRRCPRCG